MDVNVIIQLIGSLGFPIACCIYLIYSNNKANEAHKEEVDKQTLYNLAKKVLNVDEENIIEFFGAVEHPILYCDCKNHHFHVPIYSRVIIRDVHTLEPVENGKIGEVYNIGGHNEKRNIDIVKIIIEATGKSEDLITYVADRKGHDQRYAIDPTFIHNELGWLPETKFEFGIEKTIKWYMDNKPWWQNILSGEYQKTYERIYGK